MASLSKLTLFVCAALAACALPAAAQSATGFPETAIERSSRGSTDVRDTDANADRGILFSTAETHPAGTFYFSDYEIFLLQVGYAFTDSLQVSVTGMPPMFQDQPYFFDVTAKLNLFRGPLLRTALQLSADGVVSPNSSPKSIVGGRVGLVGQLCFDGSCASSLSLSAGTLLNNRSNEVLPVYLGASLLVRVTDLVKLMVEPAYGVSIGDGRVDAPASFLLSYGVRLSGKHFGFDLAFLRPVGGDSGGLILGAPLLSFTYRT